MAREVAFRALREGKPAETVVRFTSDCVIRNRDTGESVGKGLLRALAEFDDKAAGVLKEIESDGTEDGL